MAPMRRIWGRFPAELRVGELIEKYEKKLLGFFLLDSTRIYYLMLETLRRFKVGLSQTTPLYGPKWRLHLDDLFNFSTFVLAFKIVI